MSNRLSQIEELYHAASALHGAARDEYLRAACEGDPTLRAEVESLLAESGTFVDDAARAAAELAAESERELPLPETIGPFRIVGLIGEGGMGRVYEAEQSSPRRLVALKVIRPGVLTRAALRRFAHEAEVLAQLKHPGIAQIYQSGRVSLGGLVGSAEQPYFAMELVRGPTLTAYARERGMSVRQRMDLLARVCDAVQHAHQRGVIHRDLKPGNILIETADDKATPKILDFGIAKISGRDAGETIATQTGQVIGTLAYMSPEQIGGGRGMDTRGDVYALGVIGYELLVGKPPIDVAHLPLAEAARRIHEQEPTRLGTVQAGLRGDVETIVAKAIEKDPQRRYSTAAELAADIRRWLADEPISARPASSLYQLRKFARRNRGLVGAAGAVVGILIVAASLSTYLALNESRARRHADAAARRANLSAALADLKGGNAGSARQRLLEVADKQRGWEWRYLARQCDSSYAVLSSADRPQVVMLPRRSTDPADSPPDVLLFSSDDRTGRRWSVGTHGNELQPLFGRGPNVSTIQPSPDGRVLLLHGANELRAVSLDNWSGRELWKKSGVNSIGEGAFSADGSKLVAELVTGRIALLDPMNGRELHQLVVPEGAGRLPRFATVALDGRGAEDDRNPTESLLTEGSLTTSVLDLRDGRELLHLPLMQATTLSDGRWAIGWRQSDLVSMDLWTRQLTTLLPMGPSRVFIAEPTGRLAMLSESTTAICARDLRQGWTVRMHGHRSYVGRMFATPDGRWALSQSAGDLRWWDLNAVGEHLAAPRSYDTVSTAATSRDGRRIAAIGWGSVRVWDCHSGQPQWIRTIGVRDTNAYAAFSGDGRDLIVAGWEGVIARLDAVTGRTIWRKEVPGPQIRSVAWLSKDREVAIGDVGGRVRILDVGNGRELASGTPSTAAEGGVIALLARGEGRRATALLSDGRVLEGELPELKRARTLVSLASGPATVACLAQSSNGRWLLAAKGSTEASVALVDRSRASGEDAAWSVMAHTENVGVIAAAFNPDSSRLVLACWDGLVRLFDPEAREETLALSPAAGYLRTVWMGDDRLVLGSTGSPVLVYDVNPQVQETAQWQRVEDARQLIDTMMTTELTLSDQIIARLEGLQELSPERRRLAIDMARGRGDHLNQLNSHAWEIVRSPGFGQEQVHAAIDAARVCCKGWPERFAYANTLGVALFRAGRYHEALEALAESETLAVAAGRASHPLDGVFIAMSHFKLGHTEEAALRWAQVSSRLTTPEFANDPDVQSAAKEAQGLLGAAAPPAADQAHPAK